jgi:hypothetical protein
MAIIILVQPLIDRNSFTLFYSMHGCHSIGMGCINHCQMYKGLYVKNKTQKKFDISFYNLHKAIVFTHNGSFNLELLY